MTGAGAAVADKVLIVARKGLADGEIGALVLTALTRGAPEIDFTFAEEPQFLLSMTATPFPKVHRYSLAILRRATLYSFDTWRLDFFRRFAVAGRRDAIAAQADRIGARIILVVMNSAENIFIAEQLLAIGRDVRPIVFDVPEQVVRHLRLSRRMLGELESCFSAVLGQSRAAAAASARLKRDYEARYHLPVEVIRHGIDVREMPRHRPLAPDVLRIVFAGSLYAVEEWNAFVSALEAASFRLADRRVELTFIGRFPREGRAPEPVRLLGRRSFEETLDILSTMDIAYLPYWLKPEFEAVAGTSFPGKMSAYAAAGLAVFHHGPTYAEATEFLTHYPFGLTCSTYEPAEIMNRLGSLVELAAGGDCHRARLAAIREELSNEPMGRSVRRLLSQHEPQR